jgi:hypothetical protein
MKIMWTVTELEELIAAATQRKDWLTVQQCAQMLHMAQSWDQDIISGFVELADNYTSFTCNDEHVTTVPCEEIP